jgi:hypothetical protein
MSSLFEEFDDRLDKIARKRTLLDRGSVMKVTAGGLIVEKPRRYNPKFPFKGILLIIAAAFLFKAYVLADLGQADYATRLAAISGPTMVEKAGVWIMQPDPAATFVADIFQSLGV